MLGIVGNKPDVNGYGNIRRIHDSCTFKSKTGHGWKALNSCHSFFTFKVPMVKKRPQIS